VKIAVVIPKYGLMGGAESFAYELTERLATRTEFQIHVFANRWRENSARIIFHKIPEIRFPRFLRPISFATLVARHLKKDAFELVHSHERILFMDILTMHGIPHRAWVKEARGKSLSLFDRCTDWVEGRGIEGPRTPMVLPVSGLVKEELQKIYVIPEDRIRVVHPGVSVERFTRLDKNQCRLEIRRRHGLSGDDVVVLFVGMNFEIKRLDLILQGVATLRKKGDACLDLNILVVGRGNVRKYQALAKELGMGKRVVFAGASQEVEKYYLASDIFAMPSQFDTFGLVVLEAMAAGLPVMITRNVGARELVVNGVNGFVLQNNPSPEEFGECLAMLLDKERRLRMGEMAQREASKHTWDKVAEQVNLIYEERLGR
jgi:UDP-glucose:(heptosyl)LPS alpha-1,3-glucosyltransferase